MLSKNILNYFMTDFSDIYVIAKYDNSRLLNCQNIEINVSCRIPCIFSDKQNMCNINNSPTNASQFLHFKNKSKM